MTRRPAVVELRVGRRGLTLSRSEAEHVAALLAYIDSHGGAVTLVVRGFAFGMSLPAALRLRDRLRAAMGGRS